MCLTSETLAQTGLKTSLAQMKDTDLILISYRETSASIKANSNESKFTNPSDILMTPGILQIVCI